MLLDLQITKTLLTMVRFDETFPTKEVAKTYDPVIQVVDGRKVQLFVERTKDPNEGLSYTDFSIQSLLDADAIDLLQPLSPISRSQLAAADIASAAASAIGNFADNVSVNKDTETTKTDESK